MGQGRPYSRTLLIVEDEPLIRIDLADLLGDMGYEVIEAASSDQAIALLETHPEIVAVITDIHMPGSMDGLALARAVRERWPPCALIMLSGHGRPRADEMPAGARFLAKPLVLGTLRQTLGDLGVGPPAV
jgi:CheY-like chemotaxis protein